MKDILLAMDSLERYENEVKETILNKIIESAQKVCKRYHKVIEGFEMGDNSCYLMFMGKTNDDVAVSGANDVLDSTDWDLIELYGIDSDKHFQLLHQLLTEYDERFNLTEIKLELLKANKYNAEYHS